MKIKMFWKAKIMNQEKKRNLKAENIEKSRLKSNQATQCWRKIRTNQMKSYSDMIRDTVTKQSIEWM